eukprot:SAG11_NODE_40235_length_207_cov_10.842593_1_plen_41_part_01
MKKNILLVFAVVFDLVIVLPITVLAVEHYRWLDFVGVEYLE